MDFVGYLSERLEKDTVSKTVCLQLSGAFMNHVQNLSWSEVEFIDS